jgi:hypothetical protein
LNAFVAADSVLGDTYEIRWSGSRDSVGGTERYENWIQMHLAFPAGTLFPSPPASEPVTIQPLLVPDLSLLARQEQGTIPPNYFLFLRRHERETSGSYRESAFYGEMTSLSGRSVARGEGNGGWATGG